MPAFKDEIQHKIDSKTKPLGSLGQIEKLAHQICMVQQSLNPVLNQPTLIVFAADHGIAQSGVSAYPASVTAQMVLNFLQGGAAINVFCKQHQIHLKIVDAGVNSDFEIHENLISAKIAKGTQNFLQAPAMTRAQLDACLENGKKIVDTVADTGCNIIGFGEMGIGNTSSAALLMSSLTHFPIEDCVGKGTGLDEQHFLRKIELLKQAQELHGKPSDPLRALEIYGGFEIAQICGALLQGYKRNLLILVDGFIASAAFLCAYALEPKLIQNAIFCHQSDEHGHQKMLDYLGVNPLLHLNMRLGEGTGCALAYPLIQSAVRFINEMSSFESAGVSNRENEL